jgi:hypothetical protein
MKIAVRTVIATRPSATTGSTAGVVYMRAAIQDYIRAARAFNLYDLSH